MTQVAPPAILIPPSLSYETLSALVPSSKKTYKKSASNGTSFTSGEIILPIDKMGNTFLNPGTCCVSGVITFTGGAGSTFSAGVTGTDGSALIGSAYSIFQSQVVRTDDNVILDNIANVGVLAHHLLNQTVSFADNIALGNSTLSSTMGTGTININSALGSFGVVTDAGATGTGVTSFSFCLPLLGVINCDKLIPLHLCKHEIVLTLAPLANFMRDITTLLNSTAGAFSLSQMEIVAETLELDGDSMGKVIGMYPVMSIKTESFSFVGTNPLPASSGPGLYEFPIGLNLSSAKKVIMSCAPSNAIDKGFAGVNPNLLGVQVRVNGNRLMPTEMIPCTKLSAMYAECQKSFGSFYSPQHSGNCTRHTFGRSSTAYQGASSEWKAYFSDAVAGDISFANMINKVVGNKYCNIIDLETLNQSTAMFNGVKMVGGSSAYRMQIGAALAAVTHTVNLWVNYDCIVSYDNILNKTSIMV